MKPEDKTIQHLVDAWNQYQAVDNKHPDDLNDFRFHIHALQNLLYVHKYKMEVPGSGMFGAPILLTRGEDFRHLRKRKGYTLRQVEDATGLSNSYLSQLETGKIKKPSQQTVSLLMRFYNGGLSVVKREGEISSFR